MSNSKFLVTWYDGNRERISIVEDSTHMFPFGIEPSMIHDDCEHINFIIEVPRGFEPGLVVNDDEEVSVESVEP